MREAIWNIIRRDTQKIPESMQASVKEFLSFLSTNHISNRLRLTLFSKWAAIMWETCIYRKTNITQQYEGENGYEEFVHELQKAAWETILEIIDNDIFIEITKSKSSIKKTQDNSRIHTASILENPCNDIGSQSPATNTIDTQGVNFNDVVDINENISLGKFQNLETITNEEWMRLIQALEQHKSQETKISIQELSEILGGFSDIEILGIKAWLNKNIKYPHEHIHGDTSWLWICPKTILKKYVYTYVTSDNNVIRICPEYSLLIVDRIVYDWNYLSNKLLDALSQALDIYCNWRIKYKTKALQENFSAHQLDNINAFFHQNYLNFRLTRKAGSRGLMIKQMKCKNSFDIN